MMANMNLSFWTRGSKLSVSFIASHVSRQALLTFQYDWRDPALGEDMRGILDLRSAVNQLGEELRAKGCVYHWAS
jgi:hypothetical protein